MSSEIPKWVLFVQNHPSKVWPGVAVSRLELTSWYDADVLAELRSFDRQSFEVSVRKEAKKYGLEVYMELHDCIVFRSELQ